MYIPDALIRPAVCVMVKKKRNSVEKSGLYNL